MYWPLLNMYSENFGFGPGGFFIRGKGLMTVCPVIELSHLSTPIAMVRLCGVCSGFAGRLSSQPATSKNGRGIVQRMEPVNT